ncbi:hypothetical protein [Aliivibrio fischeri]|uniref:hypothetical protein n=1 Tax=Aliivibrio fischeri TaxID=668 RepID=UPI0012DA4D36|nr:hypothetical protein [Aliivibrio fischeri]MUJ39709.1 hypothetical protein [Aliivibrio fischeri]
MNSGNWWEFYFVRYFIGSILGALIIVSIALHPDSGMSVILTKYINFNALEIKDITIPFLLSLLFLGTAFCYIASAPILVLHTMRYRFNFTQRAGASFKDKIIFTCLFLVFYCAIWYFLDLDYVSGMMSLPAFFVIYVQFYLVSVIFQHNEKFFDYYKNLVKARAKESLSRSEYIETYRHLREHGNAFLILLCEAGLGLALFSCSSINELILITIFWLVPTLPVWFLATYLESNLKNV